MALDRTNMVSLLDIGSLMGGLTPNIVMLGDGFTTLEEDWSPNIKETQYINQKNASSTVNSYTLSMNLEREYISDEVQETVDKLFSDFPTGKDCETFYGRFYKSDASEPSEGTFTVPGIKVPVTIAPASTGGASGDTLASTFEIHGNGDVIKGIWTVATSASGTTYTFAAE